MNARRVDIFAAGAVGATNLDLRTISTALLRGPTKRKGRWLTLIAAMRKARYEYLSWPRNRLG